MKGPAVVDADALGHCLRFSGIFEGTQTIAFVPTKSRRRLASFAFSISEKLRPDGTPAVTRDASGCGHFGRVGPAPRDFSVNPEEDVQDVTSR
jgi:hypothetical protein